MIDSKSLHRRLALRLMRLSRPFILNHPLTATGPGVAVMIAHVLARVAGASCKDVGIFPGWEGVPTVAPIQGGRDPEHATSRNSRRLNASEIAWDALASDANTLSYGDQAQIAHAKRLPRDRNLLVEFRRPPLGARDRIAKRTFDLVVSTAAIVALAPTMLLVGLVVRASSPGPVIFKQTRRGYDGREFKILKFRTMVVAEDGSDLKQAVRGDARVTQVGRLLRRFSLDELPQLVNVLKGEMSLIGPRPHALAHDDVYGAAIREYSLRRAVKPGLTGAAQAAGLRGETRTLAQMQARVAQDIWYIENWSMWLDIRITFQTLFMLFKNEAY